MLTLALTTVLACPPSDQVVALGAVAAQPPLVELAICLDTSGSMDGLLDAARARLWDIVNELALAQPTPKLRVALLTFGNHGNDAEAGWVKVDVGFTDDLDMVSKHLFALTTNGGDEYVGRVLDTAARQLAWSPTPVLSSALTPATTVVPLQMVVVAGNESADQDRTVSFRDACRALIGRGITVNSIYCGPPADELAPAWREVSTLSDGQFAAIDQSNGALAIATPFDDELAALSGQLSASYLPYGKEGLVAWRNQSEQDVNAASLNAQAAAQRCVSKSADLYCNSRWDLVDASGQPDFKLESVPTDELPEPMRTMTPEQRATFLAEAKATRDGIKAKVAEVGAKRQAIVEVEQKKAQQEATAKGQATFGTAMLAAIRSQGAAKGLAWKP